MRFSTVSATSHQGTPLSSSLVTMLGELRFSCDENATEDRLKSLPSLAAGVGKYPYPVTLVVESCVTCRYAFPFCIEPDFGQGPENVSKPSIKQVCDVFHEHEPWSSLASQTAHFTE